MLMQGLKDIVRTASMPHLILYMAWSDIRARYKRSILGPLWITLGTAISVVALGFIWSVLMKVDRATFLPTLTIGLVLWQFMSACIIESSSVFTKQATAIRNLDLPLSLYPAQLVLRLVINLGHNLPLFVIVLLAVGRPFHLDALLAVPALVLVVLNLFWMSLLVGILGARFRDMEYMIGMIIPLLMFISPVFYRPDALPFNKYIWLNPFASMIEIIRYPLLGETLPHFIIAINLAMIAVGGAVTLWMFNAKLKRIAFWI